MTVLLHDKIFDILQRYCRKYEKQIEDSEGYLIFTRLHDGREHVSPDYMRTAFRYYCKKAGLDDGYATIPTTGNQCSGKVKERRLHRLSTHSLRHSYITNVYKTSKDPMRTKRLARHKCFSSTEVYINMCESEDREILETCFNGSTENKNDDVDFNDSEFIEFMRFYRMWKKMKS